MLFLRFQITQPKTTKKKKQPSSFQDKSEIRKILWLLNFLCLYMCDYPNIFMIASVCRSDNINHSLHAEGLQCHYMSITETKKQLREEITRMTFRKLFKNLCLFVTFWHNEPFILVHILLIRDVVQGSKCLFANWLSLEAKLPTILPCNLKLCVLKIWNGNKVLCVLILSGVYYKVVQVVPVQIIFGVHYGFLTVLW